MEILGNLNVSTNGLNNNTPAFGQLTNVNTVFLCTNIFGVCVDHLHRCKTSFCLVDGFVLCLPDFELCLQGVVAGSRVYHQRRRSGFPGDTWPDQPCVPANFFRNGKRLNPRTSTSFI